MKRTKPQPETTDAQPFGVAWIAHMMQHVRREIAAGRLRETIDEQGERVIVH